MNREDLISERIKTYVSNEAKYEFPEFLRMLRSSYDLPRKIVYQDTGINLMKLYSLEKGDFESIPKFEHIVRLAEYYGVEERLLVRKANDYLIKKFSGRENVKRRMKLLKL